MSEPVTLREDERETLAPLLHLAHTYMSSDGATLGEACARTEAHLAAVAAIVQQRMADAWDEGHQVHAGCRECWDDGHGDQINPYRKAESHGEER